MREKAGKSRNTVFFQWFKRLRATAGQGPNYVGPSCGYVGPAWGYVGPSWDLCWLMLPHVEPKDPKNGKQQKNTVKRRIFWWSAAYLGANILGLCWPILKAMWAHLGAMLAHLGVMLAHLRAMLAHLGAMLAQLGAILAHLEPYVGPA